MNVNEENLAQTMSDIDRSYCRAAIYSVLALGAIESNYQVFAIILAFHSFCSFKTEINILRSKL